MNIRSIDLQVLIPRATEAGKAQQITNHQSVLEQQQFAAQFQEITKGRKQQVQNVPKPEDGKVSRDKEHEQQNQSQQNSSFQSHQKDLADQEEIIPDPLRGHVIDIKT